MIINLKCKKLYLIIIKMYLYIDKFTKVKANKFNKLMGYKMNSYY